jgi:hypothetical protein
VDAASVQAMTHMSHAQHDKELATETGVHVQSTSPVLVHRRLQFAPFPGRYSVSWQPAGLAGETPTAQCVSCNWLHPTGYTWQDTPPPTVLQDTAPSFTQRFVAGVYHQAADVLKHQKHPPLCSSLLCPSCSARRAQPISSREGWDGREAHHKHATAVGLKQHRLCLVLIAACCPRS